MNYKNFAHPLVALTLSGLLAACGGGGDSAAPVASAPAVNPPAISAQPQNQSVLTDATATFSVTASGSGLAYQWQKNGAAISGATTASFITAPASYTDDGAQYTVVVSNADGSVTSAAAKLNLALSADQQIYETLALAPSNGSFLLQWLLRTSSAQVSGVNYAFSTYAQLSQSPLTYGPQKFQQSAIVNLSGSLPVVTPTPDRVLVGDAIRVVPASQFYDQTSYTGSNVQVDTFAADGATIAYSQVRRDYSTAPLAGLLSASPDDFAHWHNSLFVASSALQAGATYSTGAAYVKYTATNKGDRYDVFDCFAATSDANVSACVTGQTLATALNAGIASVTDGKTYHLGDGAIQTVGNTLVWVATQARPLSGTLSSTTQYRTYFQLNGNVYTGSLTKDGATLGGSSYISNPSGATVVERTTFLPFQIKMNKAARDSIAAAVTF